jgi:putative acetyltransferase
MTVTVEACDPKHPTAVALLEQSHALMTSMFPAESCHYLSIDALCTPDILFFVGKVNGEIMGCGAIAKRADYTEVKSMFVDPAARGKKVAEHILLHLIDLSKELGFNQMYLETGVGLDAAHRLYEKHGFDYCPPFGDYVEDPLSLCMHKPLSES